MNTIVPGLIGIALVVAFLTVLVIKVPAIPLAIIAIFVCGLMIYDFWKTVREEKAQRK